MKLKNKEILSSLLFDNLLNLHINVLICWEDCRSLSQKALAIMFAFIELAPVHIHFDMLSCLPCSELGKI